MMIVEKFSSHSHSHHSYHHKDRDTESLGLIDKKKHDHDHGHHHHHHGSITSSSSSSSDILSFMIGLLTHSAVDGVALGAVSAEGNGANSLSILVFIALMAHKGPAAISMTAFLKRKLSGNFVSSQENKIKKEIVKQLIFFSGAAPIAAIFTYLILNSITHFTMDNDDDISGMGNGGGGDDYFDDTDNDGNGGTSQLLGYCLLFSGGTFLYVVTLHIIPEIKEWRQNNDNNNNKDNEIDDGNKNDNDNSLRWIDLFILTVGCIVPSLFEHSH